VALKKSKLIFGFAAEYWRIIQINVNLDRPDAVVDLALYKDHATRLAEPGAVLSSVRIDLGQSFHEDIYTGQSDTMRNIKLKEAYKTLKALAAAEIEKPVEEQNASLTFFADAADVV
jgi:hypothetical protein